MIVIDERWDGSYGIGRYAREVISRLRIKSKPSQAAGHPVEVLAPLRTDAALRGASAFYSPGFNAFALTRVPQFVTIHDLIHLETPWPARAKYLGYYNGVLRPAVRRSRLIFTVSDTSATAIRSWLDDDRVEVVNTGNGCSAAFTPEGSGAAVEGEYVLYVGNLKPHKNVPVIFDALALVKDLKLVVVASDTERVRALAARAGVANRVIALAGLSDEQLARFYRGARMTLMPSLIEGFGLPALESISCGTPVAYWEGCASVKEIVGTNGVAVTSASDAGEWAEALTAVVVTGLSSVSGDWDRVAETVEAKLRDHAS